MPKNLPGVSKNSGKVAKISAKSIKIRSTSKDGTGNCAGNNSNILGKSPESRVSSYNDVAKSVTKLPKQKLKIWKRQISTKETESALSPFQRETEQEAEQEVEKETVHTQQNFFVEKLVKQEEEEFKVSEAYIDDELYFEPKNEPGILFGAAYENKYIDILENEEFENDVELNEKMLKISLGMTTEELSKLTKIEIKVDTTNTHMQYVGEILLSLKMLKLNDSIIPSARDLGTSFRNLQVLHINR